ncbi:MAG: hypothetical protein ACRDHS_09625, partial [Actinomycetota bacterium]
MMSFSVDWLYLAQSQNVVAGKWRTPRVAPGRLRGPRPRDSFLTPLFAGGVGVDPMPPLDAALAELLGAGEIGSIRDAQGFDGPPRRPDRAGGWVDPKRPR